ncbi:DUF2642 domain-containing protein [Ureibacillus massiliensis]|uniref:DUF2642 domain-containing protein n=1 Tax=Ureibacillus massiliensis TaxID=292806 RepID=UPI0005684359|nr:DUF2642 domain-containing protein [Ureibacillus massiliensis]BDH60491.1 hypothetical protein MTP04_06210 [Lysinibacillus sp. PLM2]
MVTMLQLRLALKALEGSDVEILTEFSTVSGVLVEVQSTYIVLRSGTDFVFVPIESIKSLSN